MSQEPEPRVADDHDGKPVSNPFDAVGLARLASSTVQRVVGSAVKGTTDVATGVVKDVVQGEDISTIIDHRVAEVRSAVGTALGIGHDEFAEKFHGASADELKAQGNALLALSWNVANQPKDFHPSFAAILKELTPDEARILRFLAAAGPQPSIDWRTKTFMMRGSKRLAGGISWIPEFAGCSWPNLGKQYLANLNRLGLVRFSEEPVDDPRRYALLDGHYESVKVMHEHKKVISVYRSIYLSMFGQQFCDACFDIGDYTAGGWIDSRINDKYLGKGPRFD
ncbi:Abi-alpha family protein [Smaragdicoccus niigatensis]|uniref:Abi-alpha family protein n=1 Tax=Smaragdicoccus niigatensis TaxID=359359 RepID=UPI0003653CBF|nr:Abi-alpha family protein [Smaragdicoccus niigatensis]